MKDSIRLSLNLIGEKRAGNTSHGSSEKWLLMIIQPETERDLVDIGHLGKSERLRSRMHTNESWKHNGVEQEAQTKREFVRVSHSRKNRAVDAGPMSAFERNWKARRELLQTNPKK